MQVEGGDQVHSSPAVLGQWLGGHFKLEEHPSISTTSSTTPHLSAALLAAAAVA